MSFSFEFTSATPQAARERLAQQYLPACVRTFVEMGINGLEARMSMMTNRVQSNDDPAQWVDIPAVPAYLVHVKADGHLCEDGNSYERSTSTIIVEPILVT